MNRNAVLLSILAALAVSVLAWMFLLSPQRDELASVRDETQAQIDQLALVQGQIRVLEGVREQAPQIEADLAGIEAIIPSDAGLPSALRQIQAAADDAGVTLTSLLPTRPELPPESTLEGLYQLTVSMTFEGSYFQAVDLLRRLEDPSITARGFLVDSITMTPLEYPRLQVALVGRMFAVLDEVPIPLSEQPPAPAATDEPTDGPTEEATP